MTSHPPVKKTLRLERHVISRLSYHERLLASEGWSLWTCELQERPDPLTPIEDVTFPAPDRVDDGGLERKVPADPDRKQIDERPGRGR
jgi:hypothetical protein